MVLQLCINVDLKHSKLMASLNCWHSLPTTCTSYIDERARTYKWQKRNVPRVRATIVSSKTERSYLIFTYKQSLSSYEFFFDFSRLPIEVIARVFQAALLLYFTNVFLTVLGFPRSLRYRRDLSRQSERRRNQRRRRKKKKKLVGLRNDSTILLLLVSRFSSDFSGWNEKDDKKEPPCLFL